jgi:ferrous-iron efflux pump FieF
MQEDYVKYVKRAANLAILVAGILILIKALAWWQTGSVTLLATMTDSLVDLLASLTNVLVLRFALRPADDEHRFGHGKAESLAALAQSAFIAGSAVFLLLHGFQRLAEPVELNNGEFGLAISVISIALTAFLVWYQHRVVKITQSPAIAADSLHYKTDLLMNVAIMLALGLNMLGFVYADALFAIGISFYILFSAIKMQWEASQTLLDHALPAEEVAQINQIAQDAPNVIGVHDVWTRRVGVVRFIQLHLELDDSLTLLEAHDIADQLENRILAAFPQAEIIIHQEPTSVVQREKQANSN